MKAIALAATMALVSSALEHVHSGLPSVLGLGGLAFALTWMAGRYSARWPYPWEEKSKRDA